MHRAFLLHFPLFTPDVFICHDAYVLLVSLHSHILSTPSSHTRVFLSTIVMLLTGDSLIAGGSPCYIEGFLLCCIQVLRATNVGS